MELHVLPMLCAFLLGNPVSSCSPKTSTTTMPASFHLRQTARFSLNCKALITAYMHPLYMVVIPRIKTWKPDCHFRLTRCPKWASNPPLISYVPLHTSNQPTQCPFHHRVTNFTLSHWPDVSPDITFKWPITSSYSHSQSFCPLPPQGLSFQTCFMPAGPGCVQLNRNGTNPRIELTWWSTGISWHYATLQSPLLRWPSFRILSAESCC